MVGIFLLLVIAGMFILECKKFGVRSVAISTFWVFTLFYIFSYPIKYTLMVLFDVAIQSPIKPSSHALLFSLLLSFIFWLTIYLIRRKPRIFKQYRLLAKNQERVKRNWRLWYSPSNVALIFISCTSLWFLFSMWQSANFSLTIFYLGNAQNTARVGGGPIFLMYSIYMSAFFVSVFMIKKRPPGFFWIILSIALINGFLEMKLLGTRRPLFFIGYALLLLSYSVKTQKFFPLIAFVPFLMLLLAPIGQYIRYYGVVFDLLNIPALPKNMVFDSYWVNYIVVTCGSTFEGIEHLANYLDKVSTTQLFFGVDHGVAWVYNSGLSLVPRAIWESKPLVYGSVAEQYFLYPEMYKSGAGQTTLPPGVILDSLFGFGLISMFVFCYIYAKVFSVIDKILFVNKPKQGLQLLLAAVVYINLFNLVRGGTGVIMMLVMLLALAIVIKLFENIKSFNPDPKE